MDTLLKIDNVSKKFNKRAALDGITLEAYAGEVFGFLGPNGAGKTTMIKIITGLLDADSGDVFICGHNIKKEFEKAIENIGAIVENPELYTYMTGMQNLHQFRRLRNGVSKDRIAEVVHIAGLENRIDEKVKKYSLGMKQRLGVAQAILHRPKLLVLDEPTNGLDPAGIKELRDILKKLAHEQGAAVFVSSHLLSEMELMCDRVGIISQGRLIDVKTVKELTEQAAGGGIIYRFTVKPVDKALDVLASMNIAQGDIAESGEQHFDLKVDSDEQISVINAKLVTAGIGVSGIAPQEKRLEDFFIEVTNEEGSQIA